MSKALRNVLNVKQKYELSKLLENSVEIFRHSTIGQVAEEVSKTIGFQVTTANITYIRDQLDLDIGQAKQPPAPEVDVKAELADLRAEVASLRDQLNAITISVIGCSGATSTDGSIKQLPMLAG